MSAASMRALKRHEVGGLPLIHRLAERLGLRQLLERFVRSHGNNQVPVLETLVLIIYNLARGKEPLYELPAWVRSIDARAIGQPVLAVERFNDDRFARALDRLYETDRASLMTEAAITLIKLFGLDVSRIHNDTTSVKAYRRYPKRGSNRLYLEHGHSKDHRPDLKQLVFSLSLCADAAVPIHHKVYPGNRSDDTTHIETWTALCEITGRRDFLYVADSKLCTDRQLHHIVDNGGRAVTIVPETWSEFKAKLRTTRKSRGEIWRRAKPNDPQETEYFSVYSGEHRSHRRGYRMHWIHSSEKRKRDRAIRSERLAKAEHALMELSARLNTRK